MGWYIHRNKAWAQPLRGLHIVTLSLWMTQHHQYLHCKCQYLECCDTKHTVSINLVPHRRCRRKSWSDRGHRVSGNTDFSNIGSEYAKRYRLVCVVLHCITHFWWGYVSSFKNVDFASGIALWSDQLRCVFSAWAIYSISVLDELRTNCQTIMQWGDWWHGMWRWMERVVELATDTDMVSAVVMDHVHCRSDCVESMGGGTDEKITASVTSEVILLEKCSFHSCDFCVFSCLLFPLILIQHLCLSQRSIMSTSSNVIRAIHRYDQNSTRNTQANRCKVNIRGR